MHGSISHKCKGCERSWDRKQKAKAKKHRWISSVRFKGECTRHASERVKKKKKQSKGSRTVQQGEARSPGSTSPLCHRAPGWSTKGKTKRRGRSRATSSCPLLFLSTASRHASCSAQARSKVTQTKEALSKRTETDPSWHKRCHTDRTSTPIVFLG